MTYKETIEFLYERLPVYHRIGKAAYKADLNSTIALDNYFKNPHRRFMSVHIGGTNGKGSVSHMIASVLQEAGYKTGLYTSPHLLDYRERIKVDGKMIPEEEVVSFVEKHYNILDSVKSSFFEMSVAMAFDYFARSAVEIAVIEVGLGGRLDSTNIITPVLSVITNIGHDHMDLLGNTLEKIAAEKAGIIKKHVPVIISEKQDIVNDVFIKSAAAQSSDLLFAEDLYKCRLGDPDMISGKRTYSLVNVVNERIINGETPLGGDYQEKNIPVVAGAAEILRDDLRISEENFIDGISKTILNTGLIGRWQILSREPMMICDTGHNMEGLEYVLAQIKRYPKDKLHMVIGFVNDKDLNGVLDLFPTDAVYYFTKASVPRALDEKVLKAEAYRFGLKGDSYTDVSTAVNSAITNAGKNDFIFFGGSTFLVADVLRMF
jgi:dihydrofolate synthase/folylpolyglutamate synthase